MHYSTNKLTRCRSAC